VPKLDRLARSVPDARFIADALIARGVRLALGSSVYDPVDPMGKMFFNILATFAEFEADLIRLRTREGMAVARARGKLRGKQPKLSDRQQKELRRRPCCTDSSNGAWNRPGVGGSSRPDPDIHFAVQAEPGLPSPHSQAEAQGDELGGL